MKTPATAAHFTAQGDEASRKLLSHSDAMRLAREQDPEGGRHVYVSGYGYVYVPLARKIANG